MRREVALLVAVAALGCIMAAIVQMGMRLLLIALVVAMILVNL